MVTLGIVHLTREKQTEVSWGKQLQSAGKLDLLDLWRRVPWGEAQPLRKESCWVDVGVPEGYEGLVLQLLHTESAAASGISCCS